MKYRDMNNYQQRELRFTICLFIVSATFAIAAGVGIVLMAGS